MDFNLSQDQLQLVSDATKFAQQKLLPPDQQSQDSQSNNDALTSGDYSVMWKSCAQAGYAGLPVVQSSGGRGLSLTDSMLIFEAMAATGADPGFLFSLGAHQFAAAIALAHVGTQAQKEAWLPRLSNGTCIGALAVSEVEAGSDTFAMKARATETPDGFTISGQKVWISNAPVADLILVCARTDDTPGAFGLSSFLISGDATGVTKTSGPEKAGLKGAPWGSVELNEVKVSNDDMLGGRGGGAAVFRESMRWERCGLYAIALGAMDKSFKDCLAHLRNRHQFGRPLIDNDVISKSVALMKTRCDAARLLLYKAASSIDGGQADDAAISLAKAYVSEAAVTNAIKAQELYGAVGVLEHSAATTFLNDMLPFRVLSGPTDVQYKIATRLIARAKT